MAEESARSSLRGLLKRWPWILLALAVGLAVWHDVDYPDDIDMEFPKVVRPTFCRRPPPAYRLAEPGDTLDRVGMYASAAGIVLALAGMLRRARSGQDTALWPAALGGALAAFWYTATPGPSLDGWYGWGWRAILDPTAPPTLQLGLAASAAALAALVVGAALATRDRWKTLWQRGVDRNCLGLLIVAAVLVALRQVEIPGVEPAGYWPRWSMAWGMLAFDFALLRALPPRPSRCGWFCAKLVGGCIWAGLVALGLGLIWYHRPIDRLRAVEPGKIYISAMPTTCGLSLAYERHRFRTIINLFPEDTAYRSSLLPDELRFASEHGIRYEGNTSSVAESEAFIDRTLALAQDPNAWPILVHCHACMDRTPAWMGLYRFLVEGRPLDEIMREIERHRGLRPKASVLLLYNRVLASRAPEQYERDPTSPLIRKCTEGTLDPYLQALQEAARGANPASPQRVSSRGRAAPRIRRP
ncbi:MAG TPA: protein tyrosine phosphatase [Isosphaeraceae bacterium]|jgi:predicted protein tyrosine phosphatase|nr:protein tyrosine phosphatase [Isosphaeraceae bacterium]